MRAPLVALLLVVASSVSLHADGVRYFNNYCTTGSFRTCASVSLTVVTMPNGGKALQVSIQNLQGTHPADNSGYSVFRQLEIQFLGQEAGTGFGDASGIGLSLHGEVNELGDSPGTWWDAYSDAGLVWLNGGGGITGITGCNPAPFDADDLGFFQTCPSQGAPGSVVFTFTTDDPVEWDIYNIRLEWGLSSLNGGGYCIADVNCHEVTVIPEPVTLLLTGTGLFAMGGATLTRRRKERAMSENRGSVGEV